MELTISALFKAHFTAGKNIHRFFHSCGKNFCPCGPPFFSSCQLKKSDAFLPCRLSDEREKIPYQDGDTLAEKKILSSEKLRSRKIVQIFFSSV